MHLQNLTPVSVRVCLQKHSLFGWNRRSTSGLSNSMSMFGVSWGPFELLYSNLFEVVSSVQKLIVSISITNVNILFLFLRPWCIYRLTALTLDWTSTTWHVQPPYIFSFQFLRSMIGETLSNKNLTSLLITICSHLVTLKQNVNKQTSQDKNDSPVNQISHLRVNLQYKPWLRSYANDFPITKAVGLTNIRIPSSAEQIACSK